MTESSVTVITNGHHRDVLRWFDLTDAERTEFDYLDSESRQDEAWFFRYRGMAYDLGEFMAFDYPYFGRELTDWRRDWHGIQTDSHFSATVVRYVDDYDGVVVGRVYS